MIVEPYRRTPAAPTVALLLPDGRVHDELGRDYPAAHLQQRYAAEGVRCWCDYDTVRRLVADGHGEALCWNGEEIRWRPKAWDTAGWHVRPSDVAVIKLTFPQLGRALWGLGRWRDWLARWEAAPAGGTMGSAAWSLLRATLDRTLFTGSGDPPPLLQTMGGRTLIGPSGQGVYRGRLNHLDMEAAYASTLAGVCYGGRWHRQSDLPARRTPEQWTGEGRPLFARCTVRVPSNVTPGPLIRRPRRKMTPMELYVDQLMNDRFPSGTRLTGLWTWQEIQAAVDAGCRLVKVDDLWVHLGGWYPFARWWRAVQEGRQLAGLAGTLAKMTGNALWGRFCMTPGVGVKTIRSRKGRRTVERPAATTGGLRPSHDLAETVSGQVRAQLFQAVRLAGDRLVSAHTDGLWADGVEPAELGDGWRLKGHARRLDLIDPQCLRYWPYPSHELEPFHVMAGYAPAEQEQAFNRLWTILGIEDQPVGAGTVIHRLVKMDDILTA